MKLTESKIFYGAATVITGFSTCVLVTLFVMLGYALRTTPGLLAPGHAVFGALLFAGILFFSILTYELGEKTLAAFRKNSND